MKGKTISEHSSTTIEGAVLITNPQWYQRRKGYRAIESLEDKIREHQYAALVKELAAAREELKQDLLNVVINYAKADIAHRTFDSPDPK